MTGRLKTIALGFFVVIGSVACLTLYVVHMTTIAIDQAHYSSIK